MSERTVWIVSSRFSDESHGKPICAYTTEALAQQFAKTEILSAKKDGPPVPEIVISELKLIKTEK